MVHCKNCNTEFEGNFCPECGQPDNSGRIILRESAKEVISHYFDLDMPLLRTIREMFVRPGELIRNYINGIRKRYSHPVRYFIFILAIYLIVKSISGFDPVQTFAEAIGSPGNYNPEAIDSRAARLLSENANLFSVLFAVYLAVFSRIIFRKSGYYFAEHLTLAFYTIAQYAFLTIIITIISLWYPKVYFGNYILVFLYPLYVLFSFHEGSRFSKFIKSFFTILFSWITYAVTGFILAMLIIIAFDL